MAESQVQLTSLPVKILFYGRVQGVGFRWTCSQLAQNYSVAGTVRNLIDGTVELCLTGSLAEANAFLGEIQRVMCDNIDLCEVREHSDPLTTDGFKIVR